MPQLNLEFRFALAVLLSGFSSVLWWTGKANFAVPMLLIGAFLLLHGPMPKLSQPVPPRDAAKALFVPLLVVLVVLILPKETIEQMLTAEHHWIVALGLWVAIVVALYRQLRKIKRQRAGTVTPD